MSCKNFTKMEFKLDKYITRIEGSLPNSDQNILINDINGKNVIITGVNGCGKTKLLNKLWHSLQSEVDLPNSKMFFELKLKISTLEETLVKENNPFIIDDCNRQLSATKSRLQSIQEQKGSILKYDNLEFLFQKAVDNLLVVNFFGATRQYQSHHNLQTTLQGLLKKGKNSSLIETFSTQFESYLVTFLESHYIAFGMRGDEKSKQIADSWFSNFQNNLRYLFEDPSLNFFYSEGEKKFYIKQKGKEPYDLSKLSSGFSAILSIYAELVIKSEYKKLTPDELSGIVFIDEIDAHLHVSLQKKILPFLSRAYPNIQFSVSTHSPFVLQSVDNAIVYDLTNNEQMEDLSLYSYEAILKGLLGVETNSNELIRLVDSLAELIPELESGNKSYLVEAQELTSKLRNIESKLDSKSKVVLLMAEQAIDDLEG